MRYDLTQIESWIPEGSRVLDLGCGDGAFLNRLQETRRVQGMGLELDPDNLIAATQRGLDIVQQDMDQGLSNFPEDSFEIVVLAHALQVLHRPDKVLQDMVRIGREAIVTFPNFGHWRCRLHLGLNGRMPVSKDLPFHWYDTPNIHFCTVKDFEALCSNLNIAIMDRDIVSGPTTALFKQWLPNLFGSTAIFRIKACD
ncbi:methionine biosynthesis protein MetW [Luminiphilus sp. nBUS_16]|uniref:methionine biosynthesis protein MetW n=1 Tax=Luminiphilus sp. nBUS_16 TaxID=3395315 RepID=UPI003EBECC9A